MSYTQAQILQLIGESIGDPTGQRSLKLALDAEREAINELNRQVWWPLLTEANITLATGTKEYALGSGFTRHGVAWLLNSAGTDTEKTVTYLPPLVFARAGFETDPRTGQPDFYTFQEDSAKVAFDRTPSADENGRVVRISYYSSIANPPTTIDSDDMGGLIVNCAIWRVRRLVPGYENSWPADKMIADNDKRQVRSKCRSLDVFAARGR